MPIDEQDFRDRAEDALDELDSAFSRIAARHDLEVDLESGVLRVAFEEPEHAVFVISPNSPARQVWVSARLTSFKFDWDEERDSFVLHGGTETLRQVLERLAREQLGDETLAL